MLDAARPTLAFHLASQISPADRLLSPLLEAQRKAVCALSHEGACHRLQGQLPQLLQPDQGRRYQARPQRPPKEPRADRSCLCYQSPIAMPLHYNIRFSDLAVQN